MAEPIVLSIDNEILFTSGGTIVVSAPSAREQLEARAQALSVQRELPAVPELALIAEPQATTVRTVLRRATRVRGPRIARAVSASRRHQQERVVVETVKKAVELNLEELRRQLVDIIFGVS